MKLNKDVVIMKVKKKKSDPVKVFARPTESVVAISTFFSKNRLRDYASIIKNH